MRQTVARRPMAIRYADPGTAAAALPESRVWKVEKRRQRQHLCLRPSLTQEPLMRDNAEVRSRSHRNVEGICICTTETSQLRAARLQAMVPPLPVSRRESVPFPGKWLACYRILGPAFQRAKDLTPMQPCARSCMIWHVDGARRLNSKVVSFSFQWLR